ncbi:MAG: hypothetical protein KF809_07555 [Chloroflexi bacterium]|nr:hypothetical protein [Chloroflexota bacterium]
MSVVDWHFCPHCDTQLDTETWICPACRWDPLAPPPKAEPAPTSSIVERYRGTQWSTDAASSAMRPMSMVGRARTVVILGLVMVLGLYGGILVVSDFQAAQDRPASVGHR